MKLWRELALLLFFPGGTFHPLLLFLPGLCHQVVSWLSKLRLTLVNPPQTSIEGAN